MRLLRRVLAGCAALLLALLPPTAVRAQNLAVTPYPNWIRIGIREMRAGGVPDPGARLLYVKQVDFNEYLRDVLPNEWFPGWPPASLQAGAVAAKMFAWYHTLNPVTMDGFTFDVDNTTNFQTYSEGHRSEESEAAVDATLPLAFVTSYGDIVDTNYRAGYPGSPNWEYRNADMMAQWGSQFLAERQRLSLVEILQFYYQGRILVRIPGR